MSISYQICLFDKDNVVSWSLLKKYKTFRVMPGTNNITFVVLEVKDVI